jgi:protein phosphatase
VIEYSSYTSEGPRAKNQDALLILDLVGGGLLVCVADGVGGNQGGEIASQMAINVFSDSVINNNLSLRDSLTKSHEALISHASQNPELSGMATTFTAAIVTKQSVVGVHCGDSRAYLIRGKGLKQLTTDHSEVAKLLADGRITKEDALTYPRKNVLTSALGTHKELLINEFQFDLVNNDRLLFLSDGYYGAVSKREFRDISLKSQSISNLVDNTKKQLEINTTNDNYTIAAVEIICSSNT